MEICEHATRGRLFDAFHLFIEAHGDALIAQVIRECFHHFGIGKFEQTRALFDQDDAAAEGGEHAGVFDADDTAADHDQRLRNLWHLQDLIAIDDGAGVDGDLGRISGLGAGGDDGDGRFVIGNAARVGDAQMRLIDETGHAGEHFDVVAGELGGGDVDFGLDDVLDAEGKIGHGDLFFHAVIGAVNGLKIEAGEMHDGFAHGLGGNGSRIDTSAAQHFAPFHNGDAFTGLCALDGCTLARWPGADYHQVETLH